MQQEIDDALARAQENGLDLEIKIDQTLDEYSVDIETSPAQMEPNMSDGQINVQKDPEMLIQDQRNAMTSSAPKEKDSNQERNYMDPIPSLTPKPITPEAPADDRWKLAQTIVEGYVDKTEALLKKGGEQLAKAARFIGKVSKGLGWFGVGTAVIDAYNEITEKGLTWKTATKATIGLGLAIGSVFLAPLAIPAFIYGVADYFGLVDKALNGIEKGVQNIGDFFQDVAYKTRKGFYDMEQGLRNGWRPVW